MWETVCCSNESQPAQMQVLALFTHNTTLCGKEVEKREQQRSYISEEILSPLHTLSIPTRATLQETCDDDDRVLKAKR